MGLYKTVASETGGFFWATSRTSNDVQRENAVFDGTNTPIYSCDQDEEPFMFSGNKLKVTGSETGDGEASVDEDSEIKILVLETPRNKANGRNPNSHIFGRKKGMTKFKRGSTSSTEPLFDGGSD
ncbi:hypothetical protein DID77_01250 [Candidatus Marinamargulisbacteria bacterium SCGC AG-439-L15]|nr:hypothetical protein DID77_01250 [Candidatus Marinamargulisbacteria bacterium SCGC AG-439-L15]